MTVEEHMLCAEAQMLMAEERLVTEDRNVQRAQKLAIARRFLEEAIMAGRSQQSIPPDTGD